MAANWGNFKLFNKHCVCVCVLHKQHRHYSKVMVSVIVHKQGNLHHHVLPSCPADGPAARRARDTPTARHVWVKTDRSWARRCTRCGRLGWAGSSASPLHSCGDTPGPGSALSSPEPSHQREHRESSRPQRTSPGIQHAAEEEGTTGQFYLKAKSCRGNFTPICITSEKCECGRMSYY